MVDHLATQKARAWSEDNGTCGYRTETGLMCAVGCLIPDELYDPEIEGDIDRLLSAELYDRNSASPRVVAGEHLQSLAPSVDRETLGHFLNAVQRYHDGGRYAQTLGRLDVEDDELRKYIAAELADIIECEGFVGWFV
jgi:hypothetical protein